MAKYRKFKIRWRHEKKYFWLYIYEELADLIKDADLHNKKSGATGTNKGIRGISHHYEKFKIVPGKPERISDDIGIVRLARGSLNPVVVYHEITHAAINYYHKIYPGRTSNFEDVPDFDDMDEQEDFCYLYSELLSKVVGKLYKYKYWPEDE